MTAAFSFPGPWLAYADAAARFLLLNWAVQATCWLTAGLLASRMPRLGPAVRHAVLLASLVAAAVSPVVTAVSASLRPAAPVSRVSAAGRSTRLAPLPAPQHAASGAIGPVAAGGWADHLGLGLTAIWALLVLARLARIGAGCWLVARWGRNAVPVDRSRLYDACRYHVADIPVLEADGVRVPTVAGVLRPRILLPRRMAETLSAEDLGLVLLHEEAHVRRRDPFWLLVAEGAYALVCWHPLATQSRRAFLRAAEDACDAHVLLHGGPGTQYARTLLAVLEHVRPVSAAVACPLGAAGAELRRRVAQILRGPQPVSPLMTGVALGSVAVSGAAATGVQVGQPPVLPRPAVRARVSRVQSPAAGHAQRPVRAALRKPVALSGRPVDARRSLEAGALPGFELEPLAQAALSDLKAKAPREGRTLVFLLDNSSSMRPFQAEARADILARLEQLAPADRFNVVVFAGEVTRYSAAPLAPDEETVAGVRAWLNTLPEAYGSNLGEGLQQALATQELTSLYIYSDGKPTGSVTDSAGLSELLARENHAHAQVLSIAFGTPREESLEFLPGAAPGAAHAPGVQAEQSKDDELLP